MLHHTILHAIFIKIHHFHLKQTKTQHFTNKYPFLTWKHFLLECLPGPEPWPSSWQGDPAQTDGPNRSPDSQHCGRLSCDFTDNMTAWRPPPLRRCHAERIPTENPPCRLNKLLPPLSSQTLYTEIPGFKSS